jgi:hypothetical protein
MEQETVKLLNVLRRISRAAGYAAWTKPGPDATQFCVAQYNRVLARLSELEPAIKPLFTPLSDSASPEVIRLAARELIAYFETDDPDFQFGHGFRGGFYYGCGSHRQRVPRVPRVPPLPFTWSCD